MDVGLKNLDEKIAMVSILSILPKMDVGLKHDYGPKYFDWGIFQSYLKWMWV